MQDILKLVKSRRSVKEFTPEFVDWDKVSKILDAGRHAPSSGNLQNWKFIIVTEFDVKQQLAEAAAQQYNIIPAAVHIVICGEPEKAKRYYGSRGEFYTVQNCAAAAENMLLEAHSLGLSGRWVGGFERGKVQRILSIPDDVIPQAILVIGHAKHVPVKPSKYPLESLTYFNKWRGKTRNPAKYFREYSVMLRKKYQEGKEFIGKLTGKKD